MKKIIYIGMLIAGLVITSCKKDTGIATNLASLNIINAAENVPQAAVNFSPTNFQYGQEKTFCLLSKCDGIWVTGWVERFEHCFFGRHGRHLVSWKFEPGFGRFVFFVHNRNGYES